MVRQELQFESNGKEKFALLILTLITRHSHGLLFQRPLLSLFYIIKQISTLFLSFHAGDFALVAVVQAWAAAAVGAFVSPFLAPFRRALCMVLMGLPHFCGFGAFLSPHLC